ncbi:MAG: glycine cleavage system protein T [Woeseiaceae bacterium]|nr:glycine cleavage system protein T [Woeseiaceae bacterium]
MTKPADAKNAPPTISFGPRVHKSPYFDATLRYGAKSFTIYNHVYMPTCYSSPVEEYWSLVNDVTLWDVSCQRQIEITGPDAFRFIQFLTPRDMSHCEVGQCKYMMLTNQDGGIVNDAILLRVREDQFWLSPGDGDVLMWASGAAVNSGMDVRVFEPDVSPLQLQGPKSPHVARDLFGDWVLDMKYYWLKETTLDGIPLVISRTGWSGELGYELYLQDSTCGDVLWERVMDAGKLYNIKPTAPNTIRSIEGGLLSYVSDITLQDNPFVIGMDKFVNLDQDDDFIGKVALTKIKAEGVKRRLIGIEITGAPLTGSNEHFWAVSKNGEQIGHVTRCVYSPRLKKNIGWANVASEYSSIGTKFYVAASDGDRHATVCEAPWVKAEIRIPPLD